MQAAMNQEIISASSQWYAQFLDTAHWAQLHVVIRTARRDARQTCTVRLSTRAYALLHDTHRVYVNDSNNIVGASALLDSLLSSGL
jgi:hypothetical protein